MPMQLVQRILVTTVGPVFPKRWPMRDEGPRGRGRGAREEAGVRGAVSLQSMDRHTYLKRR